MMKKIDTIEFCFDLIILTEEKQILQNETTTNFASSVFYLNNGLPI